MIAARSATLFPAFLAASFILFACHTTLTGYPFHTRAVYEVPGSGFRMEVVGSGRVEAGRDIAENGHGFARICPRSPSSVPALTLTLDAGTGRIAWEIGGSTPRRGVGSWKWNTAANTLDDRLRKAGYTSLDLADIRESVTVINGVLGGPKGTTGKGQSPRLRVRSVHSVREQPSVPLQPSPCGTF